MPVIYLSPSTQENNLYVTGGNEEGYMNQLADAMLPYLRASGIQSQRNTPDMTAADAIAASNEGDYDLHFALHSNAAPEGKYGQIQGSIVYYFPGSLQGQRAAEIMANGLKAIYPDPNLVRSEATARIGEVRLVRAPSVFLELAFHDNTEDARWIIRNIPAIARNLVLSLTEYFGIPFFESVRPQQAVVDVTYGLLNLRSRPDIRSQVLTRLSDGACLTVLNRANGWYLVEYGDTVGYADQNYVTLVG